jgi:phosphoserine aminotransferase
MSRAHNFSAGPAVLPVSVIEELQAALPEFQGSGQGLMELSHRSAHFQAVIDSADARLRRLMGIPEAYSVLFLQGGASMQFFMGALNLCGPEDKADYVVTGTWSQKAVKEANRVCDATAVWSGAESGFDRVPGEGDYDAREGATFLHYTTNNTIYGTQFHGVPSCHGTHLVADMSSDICSRPFDVAAHDMIYAGAQKNLGPSGVVAVILSPWALERSRTTGQSRPGGLPSMLDYGLMVDKGSMFNTPNTFGIFALERVLAWVEGLGGLPAMEARNQAKIDMLYGEIDRSDFWAGHAQRGSRSWMNVTWRLPTPELEATFISEAAAAGLVALKGHRSVGGIRASLYNALEPESVAALVDFMQDFESRKG